MSHNWQRMLVLPAVVAALLWTARPSLAGGPHGGGFHGGGHAGGFHTAHVGGFHGGAVGGFHTAHVGGFHTAHVGGFHSGSVGSFHGGFRPGFHSGWRGHDGRGWGYGVYGLWPYASSGLYTPYFPYGYEDFYAPGVWDTVPDDYYYGNPAYDSTPTQPDVPPAPVATPQATTDTIAHIDVMVPDSAEIWVQGVKTQQAGTRREFVSPPLTPGREFVYDIRARWMQDGQPVNQTRHVRVHAGNQVLVNFLAPEAGQ